MKKNNFIIIFILNYFMSLSCSMAQSNAIENEVKKNELVQEEYGIDFQYKAGKNLIYDCNSMHFACVDLDSFNYCHQMRLNDQLIGIPFLRCAPFKQFKSKLECIQYNYNVQERFINPIYCRNKKEN